MERNLYDLILLFLFLLYCDLRDFYTTSTCESLLKFYPRPRILMWKIEFAKNELNNISDLIVSSASLATRSWRRVWFASLKPGQAFHDYAEQGKEMSHDLWDESQKKHYSGLAHPLFHLWNSARAMRMYKWCTEKTPQRSPDGKQPPSLSLWAHDSLLDLSFQITSFLPKSWTLSSSVRHS